VIVGIGIQVLGIQRGGAEIRKPIGVTKNQDATVHILVKLPGSGGIGPVPVVKVARILKRQTDKASILYQQCTGCRDKTTRWA
jgi:hypothetical protein